MVCRAGGGEADEDADGVPPGDEEPHALGGRVGIRLERFGRLFARTAGSGKRRAAGPPGDVAPGIRQRGREPEEFTARCIRRPRVVFQPSKEFAGDVLRQLRFELDGLTAEGVAFASVESYRKWKEMKNVE